MSTCPINDVKFGSFSYLNPNSSLSSDFDLANRVLTPFIHLLFLAVLDLHCCVGFSLVTVSGFSLW